MRLKHVHGLLKQLGVKRGALASQLGRYLIVGGVAFLVDISSFSLLLALGMWVIPASASGFTIATLVNYYLSYKLVFTRGRFGRANEIARLFAVALVGLALNTLCVWFFIGYTPLSPVMAKAAAVPFVFGWNFLGRRLFVFHGDLPVTPLSEKSNW